MSRKASRSPDKPTRTVTLGTRPRYSRAEACCLLGISVAQLEKRVAQGALKTITDGRRRFVSDAEVRRYAEQSR